MFNTLDHRINKKEYELIKKINATSGLDLSSAYVFENKYKNADYVVFYSIPKTSCVYRRECFEYVTAYVNNCFVEYVYNKKGRDKIIKVKHIIRASPAYIDKSCIINDASTDWFLYDAFSMVGYSFNKYVYPKIIKELNYLNEYLKIEKES